MKNQILVTGGAGYIGSHTCIALHEAGYDVVVYDNLSNSSREAINRVSTLIGQPISFIKGDIRDTESLKQVFSTHNFFGVIFVALLVNYIQGNYIRNILPGAHSTFGTEGYSWWFKLQGLAFSILQFRNTKIFLHHSSIKKFLETGPVQLLQPNLTQLRLV